MILMNQKMHLSFVILITFATVTLGVTRLKERYFWRQVEYDYPDEYTRQKALHSGAYQPLNNLPIGIEVWRNKLFVTVARWADGVPATLTYIDMNTAPMDSPKLIPYPDWKSNEAGNCETGITNVYRVSADRCGRLWVQDTGTYGVANTSSSLCPYSLHVFDLNTDQRIRHYVFRPQDIYRSTLIADLAVDIGTSCEDTFVYFADELGFGIVVYSWEQNTSWRFDHPYTMPDPMYANFFIADIDVEYGEAGIFGMALSPPQEDCNKILYFCPVASLREFSVSTKILRDKTKVGAAGYRDFKALASRAHDGRLVGKLITQDGIMFDLRVDINGIGCWNMRLPYRPENHAIVEKDDVELVYPCNVKQDENMNIWVFSDRMPIYLQWVLDLTDVNFRVFSATVSELISGTVCEIDKPVVNMNEVTPPQCNNTVCSR